jgi:hypothetical protein
MEEPMQKALAWAQFATALATLVMAVVISYQAYVNRRQLGTYEGQLRTYQQQLTEMRAQTDLLRSQSQLLAEQTFIGQAATLSHIFPVTITGKTYRAPLQAAQQLTFDIVTADALEPRPTPATPLVNVAAIHELSREAEGRLVDQLLAAVQSFNKEKAARCTYTSDALRNIQREFMATYLLVHPAAGGNLDTAWQVEKQKHLTGPQSSHSDVFRQFTTLVEQITTPCPAQSPATHS